MAEPTAKVRDALPADALKDAGQRLLGLLVQRAAEAAADRVGDLSDRLSGVAENGGQGLRQALSGNGDRRDEDEDEDDEGSSGGMLSRGFSALKEKITNALGGGSGGQGKKLKVTVINEQLDVGLPLRTTYDQWTRFGDFPSFMKKVESVEQAADEKTNWKAQVLWSHRTWEATTVEQVPDSHIVWRSKGAKGHVDGAVGFTGIGPNLTRVLLVLEYYPQGLFERTGNLWRAQGRRARLEFQHFARHAMTGVLIRQDEVEGWRGEIRDGEVVRTHEEALEEEQRARESEEEPAAESDERETEPYDEDESYEDDEGAADEGADDDGADEESTDDEGVDEEDEYADDGDDEEDVYDDDEESDEEAAAEADEEPREPAAAGSSRRGR